MVRKEDIKGVCGQAAGVAILTGLMAFGLIMLILALGVIGRLIEVAF